MTLSEAFKKWCEAPRNMALANTYRTAIQSVLMKRYADTELCLIDEEFARNIFAGSDAAQETKSRAASILVYLLQWGGDNGHCRRPSFDYTISRKPEVQQPKPKRKVKPQVNTEDTESKSVESVGDKKEADQTTPDPSYSGGETSGGDEPSGKPEASDKTAAASPPELGGDRGGLKKRTIRKVDDDICQLDPKTLEVVKKWPHAHRIMQELGIGNVVRAIERCGQAGGFYWTYSKDIATFRERLAARQEHNALVHADHCAQMRAAKDPQNTQKAASKQEESEARIDSPEREQARPQGKDTEKKKKRKKEQAPKPAPVQTTPTPPNSGGEAAALADKRAEEPRRSAASKALDVFTDDELFEEIDRRGWHGYFSRTEIVTIGGK